LNPGFSLAENEDGQTDAVCRRQVAAAYAGLDAAQAAKVIIAYEPDDTYTVWLVEGHRARQPDSMVLTCHRDVYCDTLQGVIEAAYDHAIREHNQGFIPLA